jgi:TetR/AcrR family transcriptional repressor of nem operon
MTQLQPTPRRRGRPRKDQTLPDAPRARLLRAGVALLTEKGFSGVGIEELLGSADMPKGSFYHYFDSKQAFGLALIDAYAVYFARKLDRWLEDASAAPLDRLRNFIADARAGMARFDYRRGCLVGNLGQEVGVLPDPFRDRLAAVFRDWEARTARCLRAAQAAGEIDERADCERLAQVFWIGWEGAVLRAKLEHAPDALDAFAEGFLAMIDLKDRPG